MYLSRLFLGLEWSINTGFHHSILGWYRTQISWMWHDFLCVYWTLAIRWV